MAINFPSTSGQATDGSFTHTASGVTWAWDGTTWKASGSTGYSLPTAAANVKGGVKIGSGLTMTGETLSASGGSPGGSDTHVQFNDNGSFGGDSLLAYNKTSDTLTTHDLTLIKDGSNAAPLLSMPDSGEIKLGGAANGAYQTVISNSGIKLGRNNNHMFFEWQDNTPGITYKLPNASPTVSGQLLSVTTAGVMSWVNSPNSEPEITWTLSATGSTAYSVTGSGFPVAMANPTLTLIRGQTYKFDNQTSGHPFRIQSTVAQAGGGTAYNNGVTNQNATGGTGTNVLTFVVPMNAPSTLYYQCTAHPSMTGTIHIVEQQPNLDGRSTFTATTLSIADGASANISVTAHKSYALLKIKPSIASWVVLYVDDASRTADSSRSQGADPAPDAGVIAEVVTTAANQEIKMSPGVIGWHQDGGNDAVDTVFCKVVNKSGTTGTCTVSLTVVQLEA